MTHIPQRKELILLIQYYQLLIDNYDNIKQTFIIFAKYNKSLLFTNLSSLIEIQEQIKNKKFEKALEIYSQITLFDNQKNFVKDVIDHYQTYQDMEYAPDNAINLSSFQSSFTTPINATNNTEVLEAMEILKQKLSDFFTSNSEKLSILGQIEQQFETLCSTLKDLQQPIDYNEITQQLSTTILNQIKKQFQPDNSILFNIEKLQSSLNITITELLSENVIANKLQPVINNLSSSFKGIENIIITVKDEMTILGLKISQAGEFYTHHQKLSLNILNNTEKRIIEAQDKIIPNLDKILGDSLEKELKSFFVAVHNQSAAAERAIVETNKMVAENKTSTNNTLLKICTGFMVASVFAILLTGVFMGKYQANKTVESFLSLAKQNK